jgi:predicted helicase
MNMLSAKIIRKSNSWKEFNEHLKGLSKKEKGDCFEALTKYYLRIAPTYASKLQNVWDLTEVPSDLKKHLKLPGNDEGIDLVAETKEGRFWAIQCKYRSNELKSLTRHHIDTFISLTFINCKNFELALVCTTADRFSHKLSDFYGTGISLCCGDVWRSLDQNFFHSFTVT